MTIYEMITNSMIEQLNNGIIPWCKPWSGSAMAVSHVNGKPYSLLNQMLLGQSGEWLSFKQIENEGGHIKKGEKAKYVVFWKFMPKTEKDENGNEVVVGQFPILKYYNVWHIDQTEGIEPKFPVENSTKDLQPIESAEKIFKDYVDRESLPVYHESESDRAYYSPSCDYVRVPMLSQYYESEFYYSTLFHELTHSTGAESRLNRDGVVNFDRFGSEQYSKEELIAEMGAAFLTNIAGLDTTKCFENSVAYVQGWLKSLKNDPKMVVAAASKAEQAAKYILTGEK